MGWDEATNFSGRNSKATCKIGPLKLLLPFCDQESIGFSPNHHSRIPCNQEVVVPDPELPKPHHLVQSVLAKWMPTAHVMKMETENWGFFQHASEKTNVSAILVGSTVKSNSKRRGEKKSSMFLAFNF